MKKLDYLEQKIMLAGRLSLVLLGAIFLAFAIWWVVLSVPNGWRLYVDDNTETGVQKVAGFKPDAKAFEDAVRSSQASATGEDEDTLKLRDAMKTPEIAAHYDNVIRQIRSFAESKPQERARIEAAALENGTSPLAPVEFETVDKYSVLCGPESGAVAAAVEAAATAEVAEEAVDAEAEPAADAAQGEEDALPHCGKSTVRGTIVENLNTVLYTADSDEDKLALHKAFISGLDQSVSGYLDGKTPRDSLFAMPEAQISTTLISSFSTQFSEKLNASDSDDRLGNEMEKLIKGVTPLTVLANPFVIGTLVFLVVFVNLMMMLAVMRIGRRLDQVQDK
ncbi:MAG TPA: hypothetical protein VKZ94_09550 [Advenella sp.]|nr:hypothetical protein [Advenella sp.]